MISLRYQYYAWINEGVDNCKEQVMTAEITPPEMLGIPGTKIGFLVNSKQQV